MLWEGALASSQSAFSDQCGGTLGKECSEARGLMWSIGGHGCRGHVRATGTIAQMAPGDLSCSEQPVSTLPCCLRGGRGERMARTSLFCLARSRCRGPLVLRQGAMSHHPEEYNFPVLQRGKVPRDFYANPHFHN